jgi:hypothetical protein
MASFFSEHKAPANLQPGLRFMWLFGFPSICECAHTHDRGRGLGHGLGVGRFLSRAFARQPRRASSGSAGVRSRMAFGMLLVQQFFRADREDHRVERQVVSLP